MSNPIDDMLRLIDEAPAKFNDKLPSIEQKMLGELTTRLKDLQVKNGRIVPNMANLKLVNGIKKKLEKLVVSKQYLKDVAEFVKTFSAVESFANGYFASVSKEVEKEFKPSAYYKQVKNSAVDNTIDALTKGIHANVISPLRDVLLTAVTSGQSYATLTQALKDRITGSPDADGSLTRYARTNTVTAISQFNGQYIAAINNEMGFKWYRYRGSNLTTTREFCEHMVKKDYIHESEFATVLSGNIDGHKCRIYEKTGLPYGLMDGTNADNFVANKGGWNCGHSLYPVPDYMVPKEIREKIEAAKPIEAVQETLRNNIDLSDKTEYEKVANYTKTLDQKSQDITSKYDNVTVSPANAKSYDRIIEKAKLDYGGDVSKVMDIVRNTFVASDDIKESLIVDIKKSFEVVRVKHQSFSNLGYFGTIINFKSSTGFIGEIQINTPQMIYAKEPNARQIIGSKLYDEIHHKSGVEGGLGHKYYEQHRILSPNKNAKEMAEIEEKSRAYYERIRAVSL